MPKITYITFDGIKHTLPGESEYNWGKNRTWYEVNSDNELNNNDGVGNLWFKLELPIRAVTYRLFLGTSNDQDITGYLRDSQNIPYGQGIYLY